jgi:hypothetical protein
LFFETVLPPPNNGQRETRANDYARHVCFLPGPAVVRSRRRVVRRDRACPERQEPDFWQRRRSTRLPAPADRRQTAIRVGSRNTGGSRFGRYNERRMNKRVKRKIDSHTCQCFAHTNLENDHADGMKYHPPFLHPRHRRGHRLHHRTMPLPSRTCRWVKSHETFGGVQ